ncbi:MAG: hypothetical protein ACE5E1_07115, partial [Phycisphaerae bacterium]
MFTRSRMITFGLLGLGLAAAACNEPPAPFRTVDRSPRADRDAPFDPPNTYPGWAYDQPEYMRPPNEPAPEQRVRPGEPLHFFSNDKIVMIRQPGDYDPEEIPRVAIWWSDTNGFHWKKAGYFGRGQSYFPFEVKKDGDYGIRFVGPGQEPAQRVLARPKRVYHVDTVLPEVEVSITPEQTWYDPGELVTITWRASDVHPVEQPVRIGMLMDFTADDQDFIELQRDLADAGSISYRIPPEAVDHEITFRVEARDRAGNLGLAFSYPLQVVAPCPETVAIDDPPEPNADEVQTVAADDGQTQAPAALELEQNTAAANLESEADESDRRDTDAEAIVQVEDAVVSEPAEEVQIESVAIAEDLSEVEDTEPAASDDVKTASVSAPVEEASVEAARDNAPETRQADDVIAVSTDVDSEEDTSLDSEDAAAPPKASEPEVAPAIAAVQAKPIADEPGAAQPTDTASPPIYTAAVAPTAEEAETDEHASAV